MILKCSKLYSCASSHIAHVWDIDWYFLALIRDPFVSKLLSRMLQCHDSMACAKL